MIARKCHLWIYSSIALLFVLFYESIRVIFVLKISLKFLSSEIANQFSMESTEAGTDKSLSSIPSFFNKFLSIL